MTISYGERRQYYYENYDPKDYHDHGCENIVSTPVDPQERKTKTTLADYRKDLANIWKL